MKKKIDLISTALENGDRLTVFKALAYGTTRLPAYIHRLRQRGWTIHSFTKVDNNGIRYTEYTL